jgi:alpha-beta hydrolase superfamily lysophospholipase
MIKTHILNGKNGELKTLVGQVNNAKCNVLIAPGSGGDPSRHQKLMEFLVRNGCHVASPFFERIITPRPSLDQLKFRTDGLHAAAKACFDTNLPLIGIGHSIGATLLLGLAGGQMWMDANNRVDCTVEMKFHKLILMAPAAGYFQAPDALEKVVTPIQLWVGLKDQITPKTQVAIIEDRMSGKKLVDFRIIENANHFSFMDELPPTVQDTVENRQLFLDSVYSEIWSYLNS